MTFKLIEIKILNIYKQLEPILLTMKELILKQNPWWIGEEDYDIRKWEGMKVKWIPEWIKQVSLQPYSLNFIIGPRQVGKTTGIKLLIRELLREGKPERIFYFDCTILTDADSLRRVLDEYMKMREGEGVKSSFIFLDEVTAVNGWWRIIKSYIDMGFFKNDVITVSGSSSIKLKGEVELFPGRRGYGKDIFVSPLSFREFLKIRGINVESCGEIGKDMNSLWKVNDKIRGEFENYIKHGGFPISINEIPAAEVQLIYSIESEILRAERRLELTKAIIASIMGKAPSPISFSTIGRDVGVSYKTVQEYIEMLQNLFILDMALFKDNGVKWRKERKFFFEDPFLAKTLSIWTGENYLESAFYEWIVQSHLKRRFGSVYYFRNGFEMDCIANGIKVEVKIGKPHRRYPKGILILDPENIHLFLAVL